MITKTGNVANIKSVNLGVVIIRKITPATKVMICLSSSAKVVEKVSCNMLTSAVILLINSPVLLLSKKVIGNCTNWLYNEILMSRILRSDTLAKSQTLKKEKLL